MARCLRCKAGNEWIEGAVRVKGVEFSQLEIDMVLNAIGFVEAGEWPWEPYKKRDAAALARASAKIASLSNAASTKANK